MNIVLFISFVVCCSLTDAQFCWGLFKFRSFRFLTTGAVRFIHRKRWIVASWVAGCYDCVEDDILSSFGEEPGLKSIHFDPFKAAGNWGRGRKIPPVSGKSRFRRVLGIIRQCSWRNAVWSKYPNRNPKNVFSSDSNLISEKCFNNQFICEIDWLASFWKYFNNLVIN